MKRKILLLLVTLLSAQILLSGCGRRTMDKERENQPVSGQDNGGEENAGSKSVIRPSEERKELEEGLSVVRLSGEYGFEGFLEQGGAASDSEVVAYLAEQLLGDIPGLMFGGNPFGCSTLSARNIEGGYLFGRNFDWNLCNAMIVSAKPENAYASIATVNTDFIQAGGVSLSKLPDQIQAAIGMYAPLDGMNEKGFAVAVNMIQDPDTIEQNTDRPDITTTTAVRLLLNQAADVNEAIALLNQYDMHASMGMMVHFALADAAGGSVVVEYVDNEMVVTETPVVTNFYLAEGGKYGIGTSQSHKRYDILDQKIKKNPVMSEMDVRDALDSVSKDNFDGYESTEWSIVMNQSTKQVTYYHRENYETGYTFSIE